MGQYEPVVIEREGAHYTIRQGASALFRVPNDIFEAYEGDSVFPPLWSEKDSHFPAQEPRYLLWHPQTGELLMSAIRPRPPLLAEVYGSHPFRSYLQIFWIPERTGLVLRTYWNPRSPSDAFDLAARKENFRTQKRFLEITWRLRPPAGTSATINVVDRYQRLAGLDGVGEEADSTKILRLFVAPTARLGLPHVSGALEAISVELAGRSYPNIDAGLFRHVDTIGEADMEDVKRHLDRFGLQYSETAFISH